MGWNWAVGLNWSVEKVSNVSERPPGNPLLEKLGF